MRQETRVPRRAVALMAQLTHLPAGATRRTALALGGTLPASVLVLPVMEPTMMQRGAPAGLFLGEFFRSSSSRLTSRKWPRWLVL